MTYIEHHMREALAEHVLCPVLDSGNFKAFYLKRVGEGRMMSTLIVFTPEGIVLQGDLTPGRNGNVSTLGYGVGWFSGQLSEGYLCEKFLTKVFVPAYAEEGLKDEVIRQRREREIDKAKARDLWDSMPGEIEDFTGPTETYNFWTDDLGNEDGDGCPGYGYEPGEAGWLCAIQQRFAALYNATAQASA